MSVSHVLRDLAQALRRDARSPGVFRYDDGFVTAQVTLTSPAKAYVDQIDARPVECGHEGKALRQIINDLREMGVIDVSAFIVDDNAPSEKMFQRCGFSPGRLRPGRGRFWSLRLRRAPVV